MVGVAEQLPSAAGLLLQKEVDVLSRLVESPDRPFVLVLGGAKVSDKIGVVANFLRRADAILIGGAMANTFLAARGEKVGISRIEPDRLGEVRRTLASAAKAGVEVVLPSDVVVAEAFDEHAEPTVVSVNAIPDDRMALDIGPATAARFGAWVGRAATVLWNGPMGVFEWESFSNGTRDVAKAVASRAGSCRASRHCWRPRNRSAVDATPHHRGQLEDAQNASRVDAFRREPPQPAGAF